VCILFSDLEALFPSLFVNSFNSNHKATIYRSQKYSVASALKLPIRNVPFGKLTFWARGLEITNCRNSAKPAWRSRWQRIRICRAPQDGSRHPSTSEISSSQPSWHFSCICSPRPWCGIVSFKAAPKTTVRLRNLNPKSSLTVAALTQPGQKILPAQRSSSPLGATFLLRSKSSDLSRRKPG